MSNNGANKMEDFKPDELIKARDVLAEYLRWRDGRQEKPPHPAILSAAISTAVMCLDDSVRSSDDGK